MKRLTCFVLVIPALVCHAADNSRFEKYLPVYDDTQNVEFVVRNPSDRNRQDVVEINGNDIFSRLGIEAGPGIVVLDGDRMEVPYQLTEDGKILIQAYVAPKGTSEFKVYRGTPKEYVRYCNGRIHHERMEDLAWETDRNAWRLYGMPMDGKSAGFDVFTKKSPEPVQEDLYITEVGNYPVRDSLRNAGFKELSDKYNHYYCSYHKDHGRGMDSYTVGMTLGAGAPAVIRDGVLVPGRAYAKAEIMENGPLRFKVRLTQNPVDGLAETRVISQDKGSHMARVEVEWNRPNQVASGIVVHKSQPDAYVLNPEDGYVAYSDALDTPRGQMGQLFIGCIYPEKMENYEYLPLEQEVAGGVGHVLARKAYAPGEKFIYYTGTAWSHYDVPEMSVWEALLKMYSANYKEPLRVEIKNGNDGRE